MIEVLKAGLLDSLQDTGRHGKAHLGIGRAGAFDMPALRLANALVGNARDACALEVTLQGPRLLVTRDACVALTGASMPNARVDDEPLPMWCSCPVAAGSTLDLGGMAQGCRSYLAISGGIAVQPWLGSRSTDINAGLGPYGRALHTGDQLQTGSAPGTEPAQSPGWSLDPAPWFDPFSKAPLRLLRASHTDCLDDTSAQALVSREFTVHGDSNRVGTRLEGPQLRLGDPLELVSEGSVAGVMQLPAGGQPILLGCEHPVTGGYPRIAQLAQVDLPRLAQLRPGDTVHFRWVDLPDAVHLECEQMRALKKLEADIARRLEA